MFTSLTHRMMFIHAITCELFKTNYEHMKNNASGFILIIAILIGLLNSALK